MTTASLQRTFATAYNGNTGTAGAIFLTNGVQATIGAAQFTGNGEHYEGIQELHTKRAARCSSETVR